MCTEVTDTTKKVRRGSILMTVSTRRTAKCVLIKLKSWLRSVQKKTDHCLAIEQQNISNENKLNFRSKMAYTVEELKDIVDDNLANEIREMESRTA